MKTANPCQFPTPGPEGVVTARQIGQCISDHALVLLLGFNGIVLVLEVKRVVVVEGFAEVVLIVQVAEVVLDSE